jgi:uncharacterized protein (TIGR03032 family)
LWLLQSGTGSFGIVERGKFSELLSCPGYTRGLDFRENIAAIGISKPRADMIKGLPLNERMQAKGIEPASAVLLYDLTKRAVSHSIKFETLVNEIYDVRFLEGSSQPRLINPASDEATRAYFIGSPRRKSPEIPGKEKTKRLDS